MKKNITIGGSMVAAILGLNRYKSPYQAWLELTGRSNQQTFSDAAKRGLIIEPFIIEWLHKEERFFISETQKRITEGIAHGTIDAVGERDGNKYLIEVKTTNRYIDSDLPTEWQLQVQWYLGLTKKDNITTAVVAVCNPRFEVELHSIYFDEVLYQKVYQKISEWYEKHIINDTPPKDITYYEALTDLSPENKLLPIESIELLEKYKNIKEKLKQLEEEKNSIETEIKMMLGEAERAELGEVVITWKTQSRENLDIKALREQMPEVYDRFKKNTTFRVFKIKI